MHISSIQHARSAAFAAASQALAGFGPNQTLEDDVAWRVPAPLDYVGARVVGRHQQTWSSVCAIVTVLRADAEISTALRADFARICISLEEVGGAFQISAPSAAANRTPAPRGAVSVIPAGMAATGSARTVRHMRHLLLQLDPQTVSTWLDERVDVEATFAPRLMMSDPRLLQLGQLIAKECASADAQDPLYCDGLVLTLLAALQKLPKNAGERSGSGGLAPWQVKRVTEHLRDRLAERMDMAALAGVAGLSKAHFARAFKVSTGMPPHRWLLNARIAKAQNLLIEGKVPLAELALTVGFADQAHFSRTFGGIVGTSPRAWQRATQQ